MKGKKAKKLTKRATVSVIMFLSMMFCLFPQSARAQYWGTSDIFGDFITNMMETIQRQIEGALMGSLKIAAIQMLNSQVGQLMGGGTSGQPMFITNFDDFLYQGPAQRSELFMNDFFTMTTRGRGSSANYTGVGNAGGIRGNYAGQLVDIGRGATVDRRTPAYDLDNYCDVPGEIKTSRCLSSLVSNPMNNPYGYSLEAERVYQNKLAMERQTAAIKATSSGGFLPSEKNGAVISPAGAIEAVVVNVKTLGNEMIAAAANPGEFLSGVVAAAANQVVNNLVQSGIGQVQANIQRQVGSVNNQVNSALKDATKELGPAAPFSKTVIQQSIRVNPSTPPIPNNGTGGP